MTDNVVGGGGQGKPRKLSPSDWKASVASLAALPGKLWVGHRKKQPLQPKDSRFAKSNDPRTWASYPEAAAFYERTQKDPLSGAGLMLSREVKLICLDLDKCLGKDGLPLPWAQPLVEAFVGKTYIERSLSGKGLHIFLRGSLPGVRSKATVKLEGGAVEAFSEPHFVTVSGDVYLGSEKLCEVGACDEALQRVLAATGLDKLLSRPLADAAPVDPEAAKDPEKLAEAASALSSIDPDCPREVWLHCGMALHGTFGDAGWKPWFEWSQRGDKFVPGNCEKVWRSFHGTGVGLGTLFKYAQDAGWNPRAASRTSAEQDFADFAEGEGGAAPVSLDEYPVGTPDEWRECGLHIIAKGSGKNLSFAPSEGDANIGLYLQNHPDWKDRLRFNERTLEVEVDGNGSILDLHDLTRRVVWYMGWRRSPSEDSVLRAAVAVARRNPYDPVREKLLTLRWDGVLRLDDLPGNLGIEDTEYSRRCLKRWLIGAVARAMKPGVKMQNMLVLHGPQGKKKSAFFEKLAMGEEWYSESNIEMGNKDGLLLIQKPWIVEVAELSGMAKADVERVKVFVSERISRFRAPYGRKTEEHPRRNVLCGTTNDDEFLRDGTGARRFWILGVTGVLRLDYLTERVVEQVWAEALVAWKRGERWWDEEDEVEEVSRVNEGHYQSSGLDALVAKVLADVKLAGTTSEAVLRTLVTEYHVRPETPRKAVGQSMERAGWKHTRIRPLGAGGPQPWIYRRPGSPDPGRSKEAREALRKAFERSKCAASFDEEPGSGGGEEGEALL